MNTSQVHQRGRERNRRARLTSLANLAAKVVTVGTSFATIPITLHYLGAERFGLWMTISSLTALLAFADLGLGNGLLNAIAEANGRDDRTAMRRAIGNALAILLMLSAVLLAVMGVGLAWVDLSSLFGLADPKAIADLPPALWVFMGCFVLGLLVGVIQRTLIGLQMGFLNGLIVAVGSLLGLGFVLLAIWQNAGLPWLVAGLLGGPLLAGLVAGYWLFRRKAPDLRPSPAEMDLEQMMQLLRIGGIFFVLQLATAAAFASDNLIGAQFAGASAVGEYAIAAKLFGLVTMLVSMYVAPLWPAYGEAIARGDVSWVHRTLVRSILVSAGFAALAAGGLLLTFAPITQLWLNRTVDVPVQLLWGLACWSVVNAVGAGVSTFLNGAHVVGVQAVIAVLFATACLIGKLYAVQQYGLTALPWVTALTYTLLALLPYAWLTPGIARSLPSREERGC
ncbi:MAG: oligosaccharide flippase family protein [Rubrivivax sp.]|nr:oligosaccharide flippase family protein [Rubrivivax sp.]